MTSIKEHTLKTRERDLCCDANSIWRRQQRDVGREAEHSLRRGEQRGAERHVY